VAGPADRGLALKARSPPKKKDKKRRTQQRAWLKGTTLHGIAGLKTDFKILYLAVKYSNVSL
jgi:hypothetical protein